MPATYTTLPVLAQPPTWVRGQGRVHEDHIQLDAKTLKPYAPHQDGVAARLLFDLAAVRTPTDAARFATRFGLLYAGPDAKQYSEPFARWQLVASELGTALEIARQLHTARSGDQATALANLQPLLVARRSHLPPSTRAFLDTYEPLAQASLIVAGIVSDGLAGVSEGLVAAVSVEQDLDDGRVLRGSPGYFFFTPQTTDLAALAYHTLALTIAHHLPIERCPGCDTKFTPNHGNQTYCTPACRSRAGLRRHRQRRQPQ
jgi:hypothetical protein